MNAGELFREALRALRAHLLRSFLTLLGIIIGVATLVAVISVISGLNAFVREKVFMLAPDVFVVDKFGIIRSRSEFLDAVKRPDLSWNDYLRVSAIVSQARRVSAAYTATALVKAGDRHLDDVRVHGTTAAYGAMMGLDLAEGRYFAEGDARTSQAVAVIGADVKDEIFSQLDPLGRTVLVNGFPVRVIGLMERQGNTLGQSRDAELYMPIETYRKIFGSRASLSLFVQARGIEGIDSAADEVRAILRALRHTAFRDPDPFGIITADTLQDLWRQISAAGFILSTLIASVSLGVGGIVIMNIMLVAVVERTPEIGLRRAVGARQSDIRRQFLLEAALLATAGGMAGVVLGAGAALAVKRLLDFPAQPTVQIVLLGLALAAVVGLAAGYWPARSASGLLVVDALRAE